MTDRNRLTDNFFAKLMNFSPVVGLWTIDIRESHEQKQHLNLCHKRHNLVRNRVINDTLFYPE